MIIPFTAEQLNTIFENFFKSLKEYNSTFNTKFRLNQSYPHALLGEVVSSSVSGGSCWDDGEEDPHEEYERFESEMSSELAHNLLWKFLPMTNELGIDQELVAQFLETSTDKISYYSPISTYTEYEYYGNSTTYSLFSLNVENVIKGLCEPEIQAAYAAWISVNEI